VKKVKVEPKSDLPERVHMIAVCGTGMGALALLFREAGVRVTGSDLQAYPPMGDLLRRAGVEIRSGYSKDHLPEDADCVVVGNAVSRDNPEVEAAMGSGVSCTSFPEALARFFLEGRRSIVVVGTHGKTTSTSILAWLLEAAGLSPGFLVGGEPCNFGSSSRVGTGPFFVTEGDEYDSAFFNKKPKFLLYRPELALFTSLEFDHADIYPDFDSIRREFVRFVRLLPPYGLLMVCDQYPEALEVAREAACRVETYGYGSDAEMHGALRPVESGLPVLDIVHRGEPLGSFFLPLSGRHNALNVLGCVGVLRHVGVSTESIRQGLAGFLGVRRRQEPVGEAGGVLFLDDFAHHPTAVKETLQAVRMQYPGRRILAVFEPKTHTSRRKIFQQEYVDAFLEADLSFCLPVFRSEALEKAERFDPALWSREIRERGGDSQAVTGPDHLERSLMEVCREGDVVLFMSSGNLSTVMNECLRKIRTERAAERGAADPTGEKPH
jgi:UDP-N-acetylmuramate: L-alanyl-gamma-D-glutamyl-meso-diaminopimelate ligase